MNEKDYHNVVKEVEGVVHIACPLPSSKFKDPEKEMLEPSLNGALNLLKACVNVKESKVKRVILMSSASAVRQILNNPKLDYDYEFTDDDWSKAKFEDDNYGYAKTLTEKKAFEFVSENAKGKFDIVAINPTLIIGPVIHDCSRGLNFSNEIFLKISYKKEISREKNFSSIDIRDVAKITRLAYENEKCSMKRFFLTTKGVTEEKIYEIALKFKKELEGFLDEKGKIVGKVENAKIMKFRLKNLKKYLNMEEKDLITVEKSVEDLFKSISERGILKYVKKVDDTFYK